MSFATEMFDPGLPRLILANYVHDGVKTHCRAPAGEVLRALEHIRAAMIAGQSYSNAQLEACHRIGFEPAEVAEGQLAFGLCAKSWEREPSLLRRVGKPDMIIRIGREIARVRAVVEQ